LEAHSLVCSPREFGEGKENENGSIGRAIFGFPYDFYKEGASGIWRLIHLYVHQESLEKGKRTRMEALGEESSGASIHGGAMTA
jgi:hypothetical protein